MSIGMETADGPVAFGSTDSDNYHWYGCTDYVVNSCDPETCYNNCMKHYNIGFCKKKGKQDICHCKC